VADVSQFDDVPCTDDTFSGKVLYQILINASIVFTLNFFYTYLVEVVSK